MRMAHRVFNLTAAMLLAVPRLVMLDPTMMANAVREELTFATNPTMVAKAAVDTGCTMRVAGQKWVDVFQEHLEASGLRAASRPHRDTFHGLGGARRESERIYRIPVGALGFNDVIEVAAIDCGRLALLSREQLVRGGRCARLAGPAFRLQGVQHQRYRAARVRAWSRAVGALRLRCGDEWRRLCVVRVPRGRGQERERVR